MRTTKEVVETHPIIHLMKPMSKPKCINNILTYSQLTLSYALERSNLSTAPDRFLAFRLCRASCATPMDSWIYLPCKKPNYFIDIFLERTAFILLLITFEIILYRQLHKEMGLKSSKVSTLSTLGMSAMRVAFIGA